MDFLLIFLRISIFSLGVFIVGRVILSAVRTFVLPRGVNDRVTHILFIFTRVLFNFRARHMRHYEQVDALMALYAPISLLLLPVLWAILIMAGYSGIFWATGTTDITEAVRISGSSLFTLGFAVGGSLPQLFIVFSEAFLGLLLVALLISYLPTIYSAFSRRETMVKMLEIRAGSPPSGVELIKRSFMLSRMSHLGSLWESWEIWFSEIAETHTSLAMLSFFRSSKPEQSWITAAGAVLDGAALCASVVDMPRDIRHNLCLRSGYLAFQGIADFFEIPHNPNPTPDDAISITRFEFNAACAELEGIGVPLKTDRDQAWRDFVGWRVNYDTVMLSIAQLVLAPIAPWTTDRSPLLTTMPQLGRRARREIQRRAAVQRIQDERKYNGSTNSAT